MKKIIRTNLLVLTSFSLAIALFGSMPGCATERVMTTGKQHAATNPENVVVYHTEKPTNPYEEVGSVSVDKYNNFAISRSGSEIDKLLKEKAADIGGNAIISVTEDFGSVSGVVIKTR